MVEKRQPLQQMFLGKLGICNSKWIKDLNIRPETLKQLQEVARNTLEHNIGNVFLNRTSMAQQIREKHSLDCIKLKSFCRAKETVDLRNCPQNGRKALPTIHLIRD
jgi:hypothetical protein